MQYFFRFYERVVILVAALVMSTPWFLFFSLGIYPFRPEWSENLFLFSGAIIVIFFSFSAFSLTLGKELAEHYTDKSSNNSGDN
ncbi:MAG: hypothetical protein ABEI53_03615 [Candidatus Magasanikbacteria bacterium]